MSSLPSLITTSPEEGFELAVTLSRIAVERIMSDAQGDDDALIPFRADLASHDMSLTIATNFQTIATANDFWRD